MSQAPDILSDSFAEDPFSAYETMREEFPVFWHEGTEAYVVSRYDDVARAFKEFSSDNYNWQLEPAHGRTILQMDGREHSTHRALVTPAFRGHQLSELFIPVMERIADRLIAEFKASGRVELVEDFSSQYSLDVLIEMLDLPREDHHRFRAWYEKIIAFLGNLTQDPEVTAAGERTKEEFAEYLIPLVRERRAHPGEDLLSRLCTAEIDGAQLTDEEVKSFVSLLLTAGGETTDNAIRNLFTKLLEHPDQLEAVRNDRSLIPNALAETLRHSPPIHMLMRQPREDSEIAGTTIEAGKTVICLLASAGRDPRQYTDPARFDIHREDLDFGKAYSAAANHIGFALGRHFCVGAQLARAEVVVAVNALLDAMDDIHLAPGFQPRESGVFLRYTTELQLEFTPTTDPSSGPEAAETAGCPIHAG
jgi:pulcherriminic acid synthase